MSPPQLPPPQKFNYISSNYDKNIVSEYSFGSWSFTRSKLVAMAKLCWINSAKAVQLLSGAYL